MKNPDRKEEGVEVTPELVASVEAAADLQQLQARRATLRKFNRPERMKMLKGIVKEYELFRKCGPLISQAGAAKVLQLSTSQVQRLCEEMRMVYVDFEELSVRGILLTSLEAYRRARLRDGLSDAAQELRRLEKEEHETTNQEDKP